jgi:hypothetical protein
MMDEDDLGFCGSGDYDEPASIPIEEMPEIPGVSKTEEEMARKLLEQWTDLVARKVAVDATLKAEEVSPARMSILLLNMYTYRQIHCCHTSLTLVTQEVERYKEHACSSKNMAGAVFCPALYVLRKICLSQTVWGTCDAVSPTRIGPTYLI